MAARAEAAVSAELPHVPVGLAAAPAGAGLHQHIDPATPRWLLPLARALALVNRGVMVLGMVALLASALILTSSVVTRYFLHASTDWQDEAAVFCLVGATFLCSAFVQAIRGHVGIEAVSTLLPARSTACASRWSTSAASRSARSSRGSRARCCTRPGSKGRRRRRRGRRRCGSRTC